MSEIERQQLEPLRLELGQLADDERHTVELGAGRITA
jgi:hypothetical protein